MMASMALFMALVLFWVFPVNLLVELFPGSLQKASTIQLQIVTDLVNPGQFMALTSTLMLGDREDPPWAGLQRPHHQL